MKRALVVIAAMSLAPVGAWIAGFNFDHRGFEALMCFFWSLIFGFLAGLVWEDRR